MAGIAVPSHPDLQIVPGARLSIGKDRDKATVRYVGPVQGQTGTWVGVEWDDPSRGKNDGLAGGVRYFQAASPTAASFVRAEKVHAGATLLSALRARYRNEAAEGCAAAPAREVYLDAASSKGRRVLVELVGGERVTERQSRTELLERARVVDACVAAIVSRTSRERERDSREQGARGQVRRGGGQR